MTCSWTPDPACLGDDWTSLTEDEQNRSLSLATSSLQMLTYNRVGTCPITIRPCPPAASCGCSWEPYLWAGQWLNGCQCKTACAPLSEVALPGPVGYIESVKVDGLHIDLSDFRLDDGHLLVWQGSGPSPITGVQDLNKPDTAVGTWSVTYSKSYPVGREGRLAVALLAAEFARACKPRQKCALPRGVTNVVRSGVSFTIEAGLFPGGLTGIDIVDAFILRWAPAGSPLRSATVFDPRSSAPRRTNAIPTTPPWGVTP